MDYRELAKVYLKKGYTLIPVGADKQPTINWTKYQKRHITEEEIEKYFKDCYAVACLTGGPNGLECLDFDLKYDLSGDLMDRVKNSCDPEVLEKMYVQKTKNGGFHWVYKTDVSMPNSKLASRNTTAYERHQTYLDNFNNASKRDIATSAAFNDKIRVLIETRGGIVDNGVKVSKGYFLISPSPGYEYVFGKINKISDSERDSLVEVCRSFNEVFRAHKNFNRDKTMSSEGNPFTEYNEKGDALKLLFEHGWSEAFNNNPRSKSIRLVRPGNPDSKSSALFDTESKKFNVFTTSTIFDSNETYNPVDIFIELECNGDTKEAYVKLKELGY